jgi:ABC-2 type transport system permease protein
VRPGRVAAIAGRILRQFRHDPRTLALIVVVPVVVMVLIGYLIGDSGKEPLPVAVTSSGNAFAERFAQALDRQPGIQVVGMRPLAEATAGVRDGDLAGAVQLPAVAPGAGPVGPIRVIVNGTDPGLQGPVISATAAAVRVLVASSGLAGALQVVPRPLHGSATLSTIDAYAPALEVVFAFFFTFLLTSVAFLRERSSGTLDRLMASPATRLEVLLGYLLGFVGFALLQSLLILAYAVWVLHVSIAGPVWVVLLVIVLLVVGSVNLGIALSFYARNELQVVQFIPLVLLPQIFLGGLFWPVQTLWTPLRWLSQVFPLTHAAVALREVFIAGSGFADVGGRLLALFAFAVAMVALGVMALRNQRA